MITTLVIAGIVLAVAGCVLCFCLLSAPEGHETAQGFIFGHDFAPKGNARRAPKSARKPVAALSKDSHLALQPDGAR